MSRGAVVRVGALVLLAAALGGGAWWASARWWPLAVSRDANAALPGLRIDGVTLTAGQSVRALVDARVQALEQRRVRLVVREPGEGAGAPRTVLEATLGDLGVSADAAEVSARALRLGRTGDALTRARVADRARRGEIDVPLQPTIDTRQVLRRLLPFKEDLDVAAVSPRLDLDHHAVVPGRDGRALDVDAAADVIVRAAADPTIAEIELPFARVEARVTREALERIDVSHVLASYETYFSRQGDHASRARNVEVAASHLDGLVIGPGQLVSFNEVVGERTEDNGFQKAYEIYKGEYVEGMGGGTCQVASTLHAIAFFGGLDVVERLPHSRPSAYIPAGLDATVVYPNVDLKLRNPFSFAVVVHAFVVGNRVRMELLGADKPVRVGFTTSVLSTTPFGRKVEEDPAVAAPRRKQKGKDGLELERERVLAWTNGRTKVEKSHEVYPPTQEIWKVPPGYDEEQLPPLGEDPPKAEGAASEPHADVQRGAPDDGSVL